MADRMVGPGGTGDSSLRVAFCLLRSKFCISCKTSRNFGKDFERSFAYSDSFMNINSSSGRLLTRIMRNRSSVFTAPDSSGSKMAQNLRR